MNMTLKVLNTLKTIKMKAALYISGMKMMKSRVL